MSFDFTKTYIRPMGFSKFEFRPIGSFQYIGGCLVWRVQKEPAREHCLDCWSSTRVNLGASFKRLYFRQHFDYKWCLKIDPCKVKHFIQVPWSPKSTFIFFTWLLEYIK